MTKTTKLHSWKAAMYRFIIIVMYRFIKKSCIRIAHLAGWLNSVDEKLVIRLLKGGPDTRVFPEIDEFMNFGKAKGSGQYAYQMCVEVAYKNGHVAVRNSTDVNKVTVVVTIEEWNVFIDGVKNGEFDVVRLKTAIKTTRQLKSRHTEFMKNIEPCSRTPHNQSMHAEPGLLLRGSDDLRIRYNDPLYNAFSDGPPGG